MKRALKLGVYALFTIVLVIATTSVIHKATPLQSTAEISYVDLITLILAALSIMITILGLFVAALGVIGWTTFETKLRDHSFNYLTTELSKDGKLRKEFESILTSLSLQGVSAGEAPDAARQEESVHERPYSD